MNGAGAERLVAALKRVIEADGDLRASTLRVQTLGLSLDNLAAALRAELAGLDAAFAEAGLRPSEDVRSHALLTEVERLADLVRTPAASGRGSGEHDAPRHHSLDPREGGS